MLPKPAEGMKQLQNHNSPPPDSPKGILFLLDPKYADLIPQEHEFSERMCKAAEEGRLYVPVGEDVQ